MNVLPPNCHFNMEPLVATHMSRVGQSTLATTTRLPKMESDNTRSEIWLDDTSVPHVIDTIAIMGPTSVQFSLRATCRRMRRLLDPSIFSHVTIGLPSSVNRDYSHFLTIHQLGYSKRWDQRIVYGNGLSNGIELDFSNYPGLFEVDIVRLLSHTQTVSIVDVFTDRSPISDVLDPVEMNDAQALGIKRSFVWAILGLLFKTARMVRFLPFRSFIPTFRPFDHFPPTSVSTIVCGVTLSRPRAIKLKVIGRPPRRPLREPTPPTHILPLYNTIQPPPPGTKHLAVAVEVPRDLLQNGQHIKIGVGWYSGPLAPEPWWAGVSLRQVTMSITLAEEEPAIVREWFYGYSCFLDGKYGVLSHLVPAILNRPDVQFTLVGIKALHERREDSLGILSTMTWGQVKETFRMATQNDGWDAGSGREHVEFLSHNEFQRRVGPVQSALL